MREREREHMCVRVRVCVQCADTDLKSWMNMCTCMSKSLSNKQFLQNSQCKHIAAGVHIVFAHGS